MKSRTSFFNSTLFKKNLTRFAPLWMLYTLCLLLGMAVLYMDNGSSFWFANRMGELVQVTALINLFYAPLTAMLLFGDLYSSRMCYALHAMPMKRQCHFWTNVISGMMFSLLPTAIMAAASVPLLMGTCVENAWQLAVLFFAGTNLEFLCFFGIAVFAALCAGNKAGLALIYAALNGGAYVVYWIINTVYTPMLYGVVTPTTLVEALTPVSKMMQSQYMELDNYNDLLKLYEGRLEEMVAHFTISESWWLLVIWAAVGIALLLLSVQLYRRRKLETAGDTVAFPLLKPVFLICFTLASAAAAASMREIFFGYRADAAMYLFLIAGFLVGWFAAKMLLDRSTRVFRLRNWLQLLLLTVVIGLSLFLTHIDILGISTWTPQVQEVTSAELSLRYYSTIELKESEDIEEIIRLQQMAIEDRLEEAGSFPVATTITTTEAKDGPTAAFVTEQPAETYYIAEINIIYTLTNGKMVQRKYNIPAGEEEGDIVNEYLSRWEVVSMDMSYGVLETLDVNAVKSIYVDNRKEGVRRDITPEEAQSLLNAIQADCEERTMTQHSYFHDGHFVYTYDDGREPYAHDIYISIEFGEDFVHPSIYADSRHTLAWLEANDLLFCEVKQGNISHG